jgi:hypothetical protein
VQPAKKSILWPILFGSARIADQTGNGLRGIGPAGSMKEYDPNCITHRALKRPLALSEEASCAIPPPDHAMSDGKELLLQKCRILRCKKALLADAMSF